MVSQPIEVVETEDASGLACPVSVSKRLGDPAPALERLRAILEVTAADPGFEAFRAAALRGESPPRPETSSVEHFLTRVRAGIGGLSESGYMLAVPFPGDRMALFTIISPPRGTPRILVTTPEEHALGHLRLLARGPVVLK